jgi:hypothetical protein
MILRILKKQVLDNLEKGKVIGLFGARRTGKTVLMNEIHRELDKSMVLFVNGEDLDVSEILSSGRVSVLNNFIGDYKYLFVDEAQKITDIGTNLKLIVDSFPEVSVLVSGSSAFELRNKIGEPLTGRSRFFYLYPISQLEMNEDYVTAKKNLENRLVFGSYPQVITEKNNQKKISVLTSVKNGYLLKDILELDNLKDSKFILNLLRLIAFRIGQDVSYSELALNLKVSFKTVMRYLEILEKAYILFSLPGYSRNLRKEYSRTPRFYFWDNGIRNTVISNFNSLNIRDDVGRLWENFCISERLKKNHYLNRYVNSYFWRTYDKKEIDYIEEDNGILNGYEFKWRQNKIKAPKAFLESYSGSSVCLVNNDDYLSFIS